MQSTIGGPVSPKQPILDRVHSLEHGFNLLSAYTDFILEHLAGRVVAIEAEVFGAPQMPPPPSFREFAENRASTQTKAAYGEDDPRGRANSLGGAEIGRAFRG